MPIEKKWYESKVVLANILMGVAMVLATFSPPAADFIKTHFAETGMGWSLLNIILRCLKSNVVL